MIITLAPVDSAEDFESTTLRNRADKAPRMGTTHLFRALADGGEVGLVVLDIHRGGTCIILYELFLCSGQRNLGMGSAVLSAVEDYSRASGRRCVEVWPRSLDRSTRSDAQLTRWYGRHGYVSTQSGSERLKKVLAPT